MNQADFWLIPTSRWSFMLDTPFRFVEIDPEGPVLEGDVRAANNGPGADAEILPAIRAPVRHRLSVRDRLGVEAAAVPAAPLAEMLSNHSVAASSLGNSLVNECDPFAVGFPGCLSSHSFISFSLLER